MRAQQRKNVTCWQFSPIHNYPSSPLLEVRQFNSSLYVPGAFELLSLVLSLGWVFMNKWLYMEPLKGYLGLQQAAPHLTGTEFMLILIASCCGDSLSQHCFSKAGKPCVSLGPFAPQWGPPQLRYPFLFLTTTHECVACSFLPLLPFSRWLLYILSYGSYSVQVVLKGSCSKFSSNFVVLWKEVNIMFTYFL